MLLLPSIMKLGNEEDESPVGTTWPSSPMEGALSGDTRSPQGSPDGKVNNPKNKCGGNHPSRSACAPRYSFTSDIDSEGSQVDFDHIPDSPRLPSNPYRLSSSTASTSLSNPTLGHDCNAVNITGNALENNLEGSAKKEDIQSFRFRNIGGASRFLKDIPTLLFADLYRNSKKNVRRRIIQKNGECNITKFNVAKRKTKFLQDMFTTLLDIQWRWTLLTFALSFFSSWSFFAIIWYAIMHLHGDLLQEHLPDRQQENAWRPCVVNIWSFASCFLFSIETQHTIGYGSRHTTEECPQAIFIMCMQSITGIILQAFMGGIIFTKLSRPKKRTHTLLFSRDACICRRDGELCLVFRVGDMRKSHIIEAHIRVQMIKERVTEEGEAIPFNQYEMDVGYDGGEDRILFIWPMTIVHKIDESSPLWEMSARDVTTGQYEIVVMLEGIIENTGMTIQARSSYLPNEIKWGHRFKPLVTVKEDSGQCTVDYSLFNELCPVDIPTCCAKELGDRSDSSKSSPASRIVPAINTLPATPHYGIIPEEGPKSSTRRSCSVGSNSIKIFIPDSNEDVFSNDKRKVGDNIGPPLRKNSYLSRSQESGLALPCVANEPRLSTASSQPLLSYFDGV